MLAPAPSPPGPRVERQTGAREALVFAFAYLTYFGVRVVTEGHVALALQQQ